MTSNYWVYIDNLLKNGLGVMIKKNKHKQEKITAPEKDVSEAKATEVTSEAETLEPASEQPLEASAEVTLLKERYTRLMADFDNFRKRQVRERSDLIKRANEDLLEDMLPVLDHLELALAQTDAAESPFVVGVKMVFDQFYTVLERHGMKPIDARGQEFDPHFHEALSQMPSKSIPANKVLEQFRCGWMLNGHLVRAAQVIVSSGDDTPAAQATAATAENAQESEE